MGTKNNPSVSRYAADPCANRNAVNNLPQAVNPITIQGKNFDYSLSVPIPAAAPGPGLIARVVPLYSNTAIGVRGSTALPSQGKIISSTGAAGTTQRKVTFFQGYDSLPTEFYYSLLSPK